MYNSRVYPVRFFSLHRTGIFLSYCTVLRRAEHRDLISIILICLCIEKTKAAINLHMLIFCLVLSIFLFSNPNDLCKEFLGKGEGEAASGLKLTVSHNIWRRDNANAGKIEEEAR